jgi:hypothetical protein
MDGFNIKEIIITGCMPESVVRKINLFTKYSRFKFDKYLIPGTWTVLEIFCLF